MRRPVFPRFLFLAAASFAVAACEPATPAATPAPSEDVTPAPSEDATPAPSADALPEPSADVRAEPSADASPEPSADLTPEPSADASPEPPPAPEDATATPPEAPPAEPAWQHPGHAGVDLGPREEAALAEAPPPAPPGTRPRRRMDVDMLDRAFRDVLGGLTWTVVSGSTRTDQFPLLAETLGKPNYIDTTIEDLNTTPLFAKFLGDGARKACADRVAADLALLATPSPSGAGPVLFGPLGLSDSPATASAALDAQLEALLLRFHGRALRADAPGFEEWRWLLASSYQLTGRMDTAWQAVCVALLTHPDFYTY
jgi:hypothetical protein